MCIYIIIFYILYNDVLANIILFKKCVNIDIARFTHTRKLHLKYFLILSLSLRENNIPQLQDVNVFLKREYERLLYNYIITFYENKNEACKQKSIFYLRNNGISTSPGRGLSHTARFPCRTCFSSVPLHPIHSTLFRSILHAGTVST